VTLRGFLKAGGWGKLAELVVLPSFCKLCGRLLEKPGERIVCAACWDSLRPPRTSLCPSCGRFFEGAGESHFCARCLDRRPRVSVHRSCGEYGGTLKDLILLFKYRKFSVLGRGLAGFAGRVAGGDEELWWGVEALVPVPLHPRRKRDRGFNQSRVFAGELGKIMRMPVLDGALIKIRHTPPQTSLVSRDRAENVVDAYRVKKPDLVSGKTLLLVDDVFTTGSTIDECARVLLASGAKEIRALTIARA
jgi:competence protein ComFC